MAKKPGVLLVTTSPLLPLNAGGRIYTWGTTAPLAGEFDYHLITLATPDELAEFEADRSGLTERYNTVFKS
ncbi:MAG TPA: glycosyl transferase family 1, partial [Acidimicrobiia bacterium]